MFPCIGFYKLSDLPNFNRITTKLKQMGDFVKSNGMRVSFHPSHFCVLASEKPDVVVRAVDEIDKHSEILDLMGLEMSTQYPVNIHVNVTTPTREQAAERFCENFQLLSESSRLRLTVENDDGVAQFSVKMLYEMVHKKIGIPIVVDSLHWDCHKDDMTWDDTLSLGLSTWTTKPLCHHSSSKKLFEDNSVNQTAHADFLYERFNDCGFDVDIELECKQKDTALLKYRRDFA
jgi:UV DNA damage endonuclease